MAESTVDSSLLLRGALQREIATVRGAVDVFDAGRTPTTDCQVPYVDQAAAVLTAPKGRLKLKIRGSSLAGEDVTWETSIPLREGSGVKPDTEMSSRQAVLARLALYFLHTRGRLTKVVKKTEMTNIDNNLYLAERHQLTEEKAHYLETDEKLQKAKWVRSLGCSRDPEWSLRVLQVVAPQIEELSVDHPGPAHLAALGAMPRLRRLKIWLAHESFRCDDFGPFSWDECTNDPADPTKPWRLDDIPASHAGVVCLKVDLPRNLVLPLIAQHRRSLRELILHVGIPTAPGNVEKWQRQWPWNSNDLPERLAELVARYPLPALRLVELWRLDLHAGARQKVCVQQLRRVRRALGPGVEVRCSRCG